MGEKTDDDDDDDDDEDGGSGGEVVSFIGTILLRGVRCNTFLILLMMGEEEEEEEEEGVDNSGIKFCRFVLAAETTE
jgi:hypothetical protein